LKHLKMFLFYLDWLKGARWYQWGSTACSEQVNGTIIKYDYVRWRWLYGLQVSGHQVATILKRSLKRHKTSAIYLTLKVLQELKCYVWWFWMQYLKQMGVYA
jgi:hypothetical protein